MVLSKTPPPQHSFLNIPVAKGANKQHGNRNHKLNKVAASLQSDKDSTRKVRKEAKKNKGGVKLAHNADIVKAAQQAKKRAEAERQQRREAQALERQSAKKETNLAALIANAEQRGELHSILNVDEAVASNPNDIVS